MESNEQTVSEARGETVLVIGSSGFIGSHLTEKLSDQGYCVVGFDVKPQHAPFGTSRFVAGDVRSEEDLRRAMEGVDIVVNLAAVHFDYGHEPEEYFETNEGGMKAIVAAMASAGVNKIVFTSSIAVYGDRMDEPDEDSEPAPATPYGASKLAAEQVLKAWLTEDSARSAVVIRPCAVYGERNIANMMNLIRQVYSGFFVMFGAGNNVKATAYVGNLVDAICHQIPLISPGLKLYNYADKPDMTVRDVVSTIRTALGRSPNAMSMPLWLGILAAVPFDLVTRVTGKNLPVSIARVKKLAQPTQVAAQRIRDTGFEQQVESRVGLTRMVKHFLESKKTP